MEFFSHWWKEQTSHVKRKVHKIVERYILEIKGFCPLFSAFSTHHVFCSTEDN
jgi:hypothetical protein